MNDFINCIVDWLVRTADVVSGYSTFVVALLTFFLWKENRRLRKAGSEPRVVAHFEPHPDGTGGLNITLANVGTGPAFDVSFSFEVDRSNFRKYDIIVDYACERSPMTIIAQGDKVSFLFAIGFHLFRPKGSDQNILDPLKPFTVQVKWRASDDRKLYSEEYVLDVSQYAGLPGMTSKPYLMRITEELHGINKQLSTLTSRSTSAFPIVDATKPGQDTRKFVKGHSGEETSQNEDLDK